MSRRALIRPAVPSDADHMAAVHVQSWQETYRGTLMSDEVLDDPDLLHRRQRFWLGALTDPRWATNRVRVAEVDHSLVGIAMSGLGIDGTGGQHLHVLYVLSEHHGVGVGKALLEAVLDNDVPASLWVGDPVPRAQAFYTKNGFTFDGTSKVEAGVRELRMIRDAVVRREGDAVPAASP